MEEIKDIRQGLAHLLSSTTRGLHLHLSKCPTDHQIDQVLHLKVAEAMMGISQVLLQRPEAHHRKSLRILDTNHISQAKEEEGENHSKVGIQSSNNA